MFKKKISKNATDESTRNSSASLGFGIVIAKFLCLSCNLPFKDPMRLRCGHICCQTCRLAKCIECGCIAEYVTAEDVRYAILQVFRSDCYEFTKFLLSVNSLICKGVFERLTEYIKELSIDQLKNILPMIVEAPYDIRKHQLHVSRAALFLETKAILGYDVEYSNIQSQDSVPVSLSQYVQGTYQPFNDDRVQAVCGKGLFAYVNANQGVFDTGLPFKTRILSRIHESPPNIDNYGDMFNGIKSDGELFGVMKAVMQGFVARVAGVKDYRGADAGNLKVQLDYLTRNIEKMVNELPPYEQPLQMKYDNVTKQCEHSGGIEQVVIKKLPPGGADDFRHY